MSEENLQGSQSPQGQTAQPTQSTATVLNQNAGDIMIPKHRFDEVSRMYKEQLERSSSLEKEIEGYKAKDTRIAELEKQIKDLQNEYEQKQSTAKKLTAIDNAIGDTSVDADVVKKLLDMDKISINDKGEIVGLEEQLKVLRKDKSYLFKKPQPVIAKSSTQAIKPEKSFAQKMAEKKVNAIATSTKAKNYFN